MTYSVLSKNTIYYFLVGKYGVVLYKDLYVKRRRACVSCLYCQFLIALHKYRNFCLYPWTVLRATGTVVLICANSLQMKFRNKQKCRVVWFKQ
jgi:hypothetical protein